MHSGSDFNSVLCTGDRNCCCLVVPWRQIWEHLTHLAYNAVQNRGPRPPHYNEARLCECEYFHYSDNLPSIHHFSTYSVVCSSRDSPGWWLSQSPCMVVNQGPRSVCALFGLLAPHQWQYFHPLWCCLDQPRNQRTISSLSHHLQASPSWWSFQCQPPGVSQCHNRPRQCLVFWWRSCGSQL